MIEFYSKLGFLQIQIPPDISNLNDKIFLGRTF